MEFLQPFGSYTSNKPMSCEAIETIDEAISGGKNIYSIVYVKHGIESKYVQDLDSDIRIFTFTNSVGAHFYVPEGYIKKSSDPEGVIYSDTVVSVNMGLMPDDYGYDSIRMILSEEIKRETGVVTTDIRVSKISAGKFLDNSQSNQLLLSRLAISDSSSGVYGENAILKAKLCAAIERTRALEEYILTCTVPKCCCEEEGTTVDTTSNSTQEGVGTNSDGDTTAASSFNFSESTTIK